MARGSGRRALTGKVDVKTLGKLLRITPEVIMEESIKPMPIQRCVIEPKQTVKIEVFLVSEAAAGINVPSAL